MDKIVIKGARENNLKNINIELPKNKFIVMTGVSGSGKSSLAFDTLCAEGERRYLESLNLQKEKFIELEKRSKNIKNTNFPLGIVKYNDLLVGTILHYIKNSCDIDTFLKSNPNEFYNVFVKLLDNIYELFNEYIYPTDIYSNVLIDKNNNPKLIDLDDNWLLLRDTKDIALEKIVLENYKIFIKDFANYFNFLRKIRIELDEVNTNYDDLVYSLKRIDLIRKNSI